MEDFSKSTFKKLKIFHWNINSKVFICLITFIAPVVFIVVATISFIFAFIYNKWNRMRYDSKMDKLKAYEKEILDQLNLVDGKK